MEARCKAALAMALVSCGLLLGACGQTMSPGGGSYGAGGTGTAAGDSSTGGTGVLNVTATGTLSAGITTLRATVTAADIATPVQVSVGSSTSTFTVSVPPGSGRTVVVDGLNASLFVVDTGQTAGVTATSSSATAVTVSMAPAPAAPTWAAVQAGVFSGCSCHLTPSPPAGLSWASSEYTNIVTNGKLSSELTAMKIVQPGNRQFSYVYLKLMGDPRIGSTARMPFGGPYLTPAQIGQVGAWIDGGAPQ